MPDLEPAWTFTAGGLVTASPAVVNGVLYVPASDGRVYALNATTGALVWQSAAIEAGYPSPAVVGGRVYVGDGRRLLPASTPSTPLREPSYGALRSSAAA